MFKIKFTFDAYQVHIKAPNELLIELMFSYAAQTHHICHLLKMKNILGNNKFDEIRL